MLSKLVGADFHFPFFKYPPKIHGSGRTVSATKCRLKVCGKTVLSGAREVGGMLYKAAIEPIIPSIKEEVDVADSNSSMLQLNHERWGHQDKLALPLQLPLQEMLRKELNIRVNLLTTRFASLVFTKKRIVYLLGQEKKLPSRES